MPEWIRQHPVADVDLVLENIEQLRPAVLGIEITLHAAGVVREIKED